MWFCAIHYDYKDQLMPRLHELSIDAVFYGHGGSKDQEFFDGVGALNGHLPRYPSIISTWVSHSVLMCWEYRPKRSDNA